MIELEHWLLLALSVLVARQRMLAAGEADLVAVAALRDPLRFEFAYLRGAHRCLVARERLALFQASLLVLERQDFVSPVSALRPQLRLLDRGAEGYEAKLLPPFVEALALADDDPVLASYSPLQLLFHADTGFFIPGREPWHAYAGRALARQMPQARLERDAACTRLRWADGTLELCDTPLGFALTGRTPALEFELAVVAEGFALRLQASASVQGLAADLRRLCAAAERPVGVAVETDAAGALRIRGAL